jgi:hypothetical protein
MKKFVCLAVIATLVGCSEPADTPPSGLVVTVDEPAGENCAEGGVAVLTGVDTDADGDLAGSEIDSTRYVCNGDAGSTGDSGPAGPSGDDGPASLVETVEATTCGDDAGGVVVRVGTDTNGDGSLQDDEITGEETVCDGSAAEIGEVLITETTIDPGPVCGGGGTAIRVGHDEDGDGELGDAEVASELVECGPCPVDFAPDPADANQCVAVRTIVFEGVFDSVTDPDGLNPGVAPGDRFAGEIQFMEQPTYMDTDPDTQKGLYEFRNAPTRFTVRTLTATLESRPAAEVDVEILNDFGIAHHDEFAVSSVANETLLGLPVQWMRLLLRDEDGDRFVSDGFRGPLMLEHVEAAKFDVIFGDVNPMDGPGGPILGSVAMASGTVTRVEYR